MSSPLETIDRVLGWLGGLFQVFVPRMPLSGVYRRLTTLFQMPVAAKLPEPTDPLPWTIPAAEDWERPFPSLDVSLNAIQIYVASAPPYDAASGSPDPRPPP